MFSFPACLDNSKITLARNLACSSFGTDYILLSAHKENSLGNGEVVHAVPCTMCICKGVLQFRIMVLAAWEISMNSLCYPQSEDLTNGFWKNKCRKAWSSRSNEVSSHIFFFSSQAETNYCGQAISLLMIIK